MESKDMAPVEIRPAPQSNKRRISLRLDPGALFRHGEDELEFSPSSSTIADSPLITPRPSSSGSEIVEGEEEIDGASGSQKSGKDKEKRKRSRVTPEQLVHLEKLFSVDQSPTATRRREISDQLGMQERQTQIWFQNRRAKAKLQREKAKSKLPPETPPPSSSLSPALSPSVDTRTTVAINYEADIRHLIHEDEAVTLIPCSDLTVGTWRRIATAVGIHDLVAYVCEAKRCLTWFIQSNGHGFKMEIPCQTILDVEFTIIDAEVTAAAPGSAVASFVLSQPPIFFLEHFSSPPPNGTPTRHWKRCTDWTEGYQATHVLRHDLIGSALELAQLVRNLQQSSNPGSEIALHTPSYEPQSPTSPMELPAPPMAALGGATYRYPGEPESPPAPERSFKREPVETSLDMSSPSSGPEFSRDAVAQPPHSAPMTSFPPSSFSSMPGSSMPTSASYGYDEYQGGHHMEGIHHGSQSSNYGLPISHGLAPRTFTAQTMQPIQPQIQQIQRPFYGAEQRLTQSYRVEAPRRHSSTFSQFPSPSPPLLTTPYHPPPHITQSFADNQVNHSNHPTSINSGLPGMPYEADMFPRQGVDPSLFSGR